MNYMSVYLLLLITFQSTSMLPADEAPKKPSLITQWIERFKRLFKKEDKNIERKIP